MSISLGEMGDEEDVLAIYMGAVNAQAITVHRTSDVGQGFGDRSGSKESTNPLPPPAIPSVAQAKSHIPTDDNPEHAPHLVEKETTVLNREVHHDNRLDVGERSVSKAETVHGDDEDDVMAIYGGALNTKLAHPLAVPQTAPQSVAVRIPATNAVGQVDSLDSAASSIPAGEGRGELPPGWIRIHSKKDPTKIGYQEVSSGNKTGDLKKAWDHYRKQNPEAAEADAAAGAEGGGALEKVPTIDEDQLNASLRRTPLQEDDEPNVWSKMQQVKHVDQFGADVNAMLNDSDDEASKNKKVNISIDAKTGGKKKPAKATKDSPSDVVASELPFDAAYREPGTTEDYMSVGSGTTGKDFAVDCTTEDVTVSKQLPRLYGNELILNSPSQTPMNMTPRHSGTDKTIVSNQEASEAVSKQNSVRSSGVDPYSKNPSKEQGKSEPSRGEKAADAPKQCVSNGTIFIEEHKLVMKENELPGAEPETHLKPPEGTPPEEAVDEHDKVSGDSKATSFHEMSLASSRKGSDAEQKKYDPSKVPQKSDDNNGPIYEGGIDPESLEAEYLLKTAPSPEAQNQAKEMLNKTKTGDKSDQRAVTRQKTTDAVMGSVTLDDLNVEEDKISAALATGAPTERGSASGKNDENAKAESEKGKPPTAHRRGSLTKKELEQGLSQQLKKIEPTAEKDTDGAADTVGTADKDGASDSKTDTADMGTKSEVTKIEFIDKNDDAPRQTNRGTQYRLVASLTFNANDAQTVTALGLEEAVRKSLTLEKDDEPAEKEDDLRDPDVVVRRASLLLEQMKEGGGISGLEAPKAAEADGSRFGSESSDSEVKQDDKPESRDNAKKAQTNAKDSRPAPVVDEIGQNNLLGAVKRTSLTQNQGFADDLSHMADNESNTAAGGRNDQDINDTDMVMPVSREASKLPPDSTPASGAHAAKSVPASHLFIGGGGGGASAMVAPTALVGGMKHLGANLGAPDICINKLGSDLSFAVASQGTGTETAGVEMSALLIPSRMCSKEEPAPHAISASAPPSQAEGETSTGAVGAMDTTATTVATTAGSLGKSASLSSPAHPTSPDIAQNTAVNARSTAATEEVRKPSKTLDTGVVAGSQNVIRKQTSILKNKLPLEGTVPSSIETVRQEPYRQTSKGKIQFEAANTSAPAAEPEVLASKVSAEDAAFIDKFVTDTVMPNFVLTPAETILFADRTIEVLASDEEGGVPVAPVDHGQARQSFIMRKQAIEAKIAKEEQEKTELEQLQREGLKDAPGETVDQRTIVCASPVAWVDEPRQQTELIIHARISSPAHNRDGKLRIERQHVWQDGQYMELPPDIEVLAMGKKKVSSPRRRDDSTNPEVEITEVERTGLSVDISGLFANREGPGGVFREQSGAERSSSAPAATRAQGWISPRRGDDGSIAGDDWSDDDNLQRGMLSSAGFVRVLNKISPKVEKLEELLETFDPDQTVSEMSCVNDFLTGAASPRCRVESPNASSVGGRLSCAECGRSHKQLPGIGSRENSKSVKTQQRQSDEVSSRPCSSGTNLSPRAEPLKALREYQRKLLQLEKLEIDWLISCCSRKNKETTPTEKKDVDGNTHKVNTVLEAITIEALVDNDMERELKTLAEEFRTSDIRAKARRLDQDDLVRLIKAQQEETAKFERIIGKIAKGFYSSGKKDGNLFLNHDQALIEKYREDQKLREDEEKADASPKVDAGDAKKADGGAFVSKKSVIVADNALLPKENEKSEVARDETKIEYSKSAPVAEMRKQDRKYRKSEDISKSKKKSLKNMNGVASMSMAAHSSTMGILNFLMDTCESMGDCKSEKDKTEAAKSHEKVEADKTDSPERPASPEVLVAPSKQGDIVRKTENAGEQSGEVLKEELAAIKKKHVSLSCTSNDIAILSQIQMRMAELKELEKQIAEHLRPTSDSESEIVGTFMGESKDLIRRQRLLRDVIRKSAPASGMPSPLTSYRVAYPASRRDGSPLRHVSTSTWIDRQNNNLIRGDGNVFPHLPSLYQMQYESMQQKRLSGGSKTTSYATLPGAGATKRSLSTPGKTTGGWSSQTRAPTTTPGAKTTTTRFSGTNYVPPANVGAKRRTSRNSGNTKVMASTWGGTQNNQFSTKSIDTYNPTNQYSDASIRPMQVVPSGASIQTAGSMWTSADRMAQPQVYAQTYHGASPAGYAGAAFRVYATAPIGKMGGMNVAGEDEVMENFLRQTDQPSTAPPLSMGQLAPSALPSSMAGHSTAIAQAANVSSKSEKVENGKPSAKPESKPGSKPGSKPATPPQDTAAHQNRQGAQQGSGKEGTPQSKEKPAEPDTTVEKKLATLKTAKSMVDEIGSKDAGGNTYLGVAAELGDQIHFYTDASGNYFVLDKSQPPERDDKGKAFFRGKTLDDSMFVLAERLQQDLHFTFHGVQAEPAPDTAATAQQRTDQGLASQGVKQSETAALGTKSAPVKSTHPAAKKASGAAAPASSGLKAKAGAKNGNRPNGANRNSAPPRGSPSPKRNSRSSKAKKPEQMQYIAAPVPFVQNGAVQNYGQVQPAVAYALSRAPSGALVVVPQPAAGFPSAVVPSHLLPIVPEIEQLSPFDGDCDANYTDNESSCGLSPVAREILRGKKKVDKTSPKRKYYMQNAHLKEDPHGRWVSSRDKWGNVKRVYVDVLGRERRPPSPVEQRSLSPPGSTLRMQHGTLIGQPGLGFLGHLPPQQQLYYQQQIQLAGLMGQDIHGNPYLAPLETSLPAANLPSPGFGSNATDIMTDAGALMASAELGSDEAEFLASIVDIENPTADSPSGPAEEAPPALAPSLTNSKDTSVAKDANQPHMVYAKTGNYETSQSELTSGVTPMAPKAMASGNAALSSCGNPVGSPNLGAAQNRTASVAPGSDQTPTGSVAPAPGTCLYVNAMSAPNVSGGPHVMAAVTANALNVSVDRGSANSLYANALNTPLPGAGANAMIVVGNDPNVSLCAPAIPATTANSLYGNAANAPNLALGNSNGAFLAISNADGTVAASNADLCATVNPGNSIFQNAAPAPQVKTTHARHGLPNVSMAPEQQGNRDGSATMVPVVQSSTPAVDRAAPLQTLPTETEERKIDNQMSTNQSALELSAPPQQQDVEGSEQSIPGSHREAEHVAAHVDLGTEGVLQQSYHTQALQNSEAVGQHGVSILKMQSGCSPVQSVGLQNQTDHITTSRIIPPSQQPRSLEQEYASTELEDGIIPVRSVQKSDSRLKPDTPDDALMNSDVEPPSTSQYETKHNPASAPVGQLISKESAKEVVQGFEVLVSESKVRMSAEHNTESIFVIEDNRSGEDEAENSMSPSQEISDASSRKNTTKKKRKRSPKIPVVSRKVKGVRERRQKLAEAKAAKDREKAEQDRIDKEIVGEIEAERLAREQAQPGAEEQTEVSDTEPVEEVPVMVDSAVEKNPAKPQKKKSPRSPRSPKPQSGGEISKFQCKARSATPNTNKGSKKRSQSSAKDDNIGASGSTLPGSSSDKNTPSQPITHIVPSHIVAPAVRPAQIGKAQLKHVAETLKTETQQMLKTEFSDLEKRIMGLEARSKRMQNQIASNAQSLTAMNENPIVGASPGTNPHGPNTLYSPGAHQYFTETPVAAMCIDNSGYDNARFYTARVGDHYLYKNKVTRFANTAMRNHCSGWRSQKNQKQKPATSGILPPGEYTTSGGSADEAPPAQSAQNGSAVDSLKGKGKGGNVAAMSMHNVAALPLTQRYELTKQIYEKPLVAFAQSRRQCDNNRKYNNMVVISPVNSPSMLCREPVYLNDHGTLVAGTPQHTHTSSVSANQTHGSTMQGATTSDYHSTANSTRPQQTGKDALSSTMPLPGKNTHLPDIGSNVSVFNDHRGDTRMAATYGATVATDVQRAQYQSSAKTPTTMVPLKYLHLKHKEHQFRPIPLNKYGNVRKQEAEYYTELVNHHSNLQHQLMQILDEKNAKDGTNYMLTADGKVLDQSGAHIMNWGCEPKNSNQQCQQGSLGQPPAQAYQQQSNQTQNQLQAQQQEAQYQQSLQHQQDEQAAQRQHHPQQPPIYFYDHPEDGFIEIPEEYHQKFNMKDLARIASKSASKDRVASKDRQHSPSSMGDSPMVTNIGRIQPTPPSNPQTTNESPRKQKAKLPPGYDTSCDGLGATNTSSAVMTNSTDTANIMGGSNGIMKTTNGIMGTSSGLGMTNGLAQTNGLHTTNNGTQPREKSSSFSDTIQMLSTSQFEAMMQYPADGYAAPGLGIIRNTEKPSTAGTSTYGKPMASGMASEVTGMSGKGVTGSTMTGGNTGKGVTGSTMTGGNTNYGNTGYTTNNNLQKKGGFLQHRPSTTPGKAQGLGKGRM